MRERGFTLIEMAVVLAIIAVLAAVLTPMVTGYLDQARVVRATADVKTIADAVRIFYRDTSRYPVSGGPSYLVGAGAVPLTGTTSWPSLTSTSSLMTVLNTNIFGLSTASQVTNVGKVAWRGPYIGSLDSDPWGNQYLIPTANLSTTSTNWAIVISAGANGVLETTISQPNSSPFAVSGDDIVAIIK